MLRVQKKCRICGEVYTIPMTETEHELLMSGVHIQDALPNHSADDRELLLSGICGKCFDELFYGEEAEE